MVKTLISIIIVLIFSFIAAFALLHPGLPPTHDGEYHVIRFYEFDKTFHDGSWYPRWAPDLNFGFGMPLFTYVYPFPNYVATFLHLFGSGFIHAVKLNMFFAILIGGLFFFLWSKLFWGNIGGIVSSICYTFSPYHFVDVYIRGSVGEVWALAWYPAFLWSISILIITENRKYIAVSSIFLAFIIFSHNILALAFLPFAILYSLILLISTKNKKRVIKYLVIAYCLGLGLSMIFWLPALVESKYVTGLQVFSLENNFPEIYQLIFPSWGSDIFGAGNGNDMSVQIGIVNLLIVFANIILIPLSIIKQNIYKKLNIFFLLIFFIVFIIMLKLSLPIWDHVPLMHYFQFPWRFLSLEILICSFLAGNLIFLFRSRILAFFLILFILSTTIGYAKPDHYLYRQDTYYTTRSNFIDGTNSPGDIFQTIWMSGNKQRKRVKGGLLKSTGSIDTNKITSTNYIFHIKLREASKMLINTTFFPGWKAYINRKEIPIHRTKDGIIILTIPRGKYELNVRLENTFIQFMSLTGTIVSLSLMLMLFMKSYSIFRIKIDETKK